MTSTSRNASVTASPGREKRLLRFRPSETRRKQLRYVVSSGASVIVGEIVLAFSYGVLRWSAAFSNIVSFVVAGVVSYFLHRRWTWRKSGRSRLFAELLPYWGIALVSLVLSTWAVDFVSDRSSRLTDSRPVQTLAVMVAALVVNGVFWVVKYVVFDRWLFARPQRAT